MKSLQTIMRELLSELPIEQQRRISNFQALDNWPDIVGEKIAAVTEPVKLEREVLLIQVKEAAWKTDLQFMKMDILKTIVEKTGLKLKDLKFV